MTALARAGLAPVYGLNYKAKREDAIAWLQRYGDPYQASYPTSRRQGRIDYGCTACPRPTVIDKQGSSATSGSGRSSPDTQEKIAPLIAELNRNG